MRRLPAFPLLTFAWTRVAILLGAAVAYQVLQAQGSGPNGGPVPKRFGTGSGWAIDLWGRWDSGWFLRIAEHGYVQPHYTAAFFPLYPYSVRVVAWPLGGREVLAGVLISLAASAVAVVLLYDLVCGLLGEDDARRSVLYLLVFPTTLFLIAVYSESLYLALSIGTFLAAIRGKWLTAGILCGLAMLTRSAGVALLVPLVLIAWQSTDRRRALLRAAVALPIAALWPAYLWIRFSDPLLFAHAQHEHFGRHLSAGGPLGGLWWGLVAGWNGVRQFLGPTGANYFPNATDHPPAYTAAISLEYLGFAILVIALGVSPGDGSALRMASSYSGACCCPSPRRRPTTRSSRRRASRSGRSRSSSRSRRWGDGAPQTSRSPPSARSTSGSTWRDGCCTDSSPEASVRDHDDNPVASVASLTAAGRACATAAPPPP